MSTAGSAPETAPPIHVDTTPNNSTPVSTETHSEDDKTATDDDALQRSITNPVAAVDPTAQFQHDGTDVNQVPDLEKSPAVSEKEDPNIVDFNGPDDPEKAVNWSFKQKYSMLALISVMTFITYARNTPFSANQ